MDVNVTEEMAMVREALGTAPNEMVRRQFLERWWRTPEALQIARSAYGRGEFSYDSGMTREELSEWNRKLHAQQPIPLPRAG